LTNTTSCTDADAQAHRKYIHPDHATLAPIVAA